MTADERLFANAALRAGSRDNHDELVIAVGAGLKRDPQTVESVLQRLRIRMVLVCTSAADAVSQIGFVRYQRGVEWMDEE